VKKDLCQLGKERADVVECANKAEASRAEMFIAGTCTLQMAPNAPLFSAKIPADMQAAINAKLPIVPVALRYTDQTGQLNVEPAFVGDQTMAENVMILWKSRNRFTATLTPSPAVYNPDWTRHEYAQACKTAIELTLRDSENPTQH
jgi:hypothetical protein